MWACSAVDVLMVYILYSELTQKIDTLTHLLNRRSYESRPASLRGQAVIYYFDVDEFKSVNDTFGHGVGDAVLAEVGSTIYAASSCGWSLLPKYASTAPRMAHAMPQTISAVEAKSVGMIMIVEASTMPMTA